MNDWTRFRIGAVNFRSAGPCTRCPITTTNQQTAERGGKDAEPIKDQEDLARLPDGPATEPWYDHKGFFEHKLAEPNIYDQGKVRSETEALRMPNVHLSKDQVRELTTFLMGSEETSLPASYQYKPGDARHDFMKNCLIKHQAAVRGVLHVGGHLGEEYPLYREAGAQKIVFFEPMPEFYDELTKRLKGREGVMLVKKALGGA